MQSAVIGRYASHAAWRSGGVAVGRHRTLHAAHRPACCNAYTGGKSSSFRRSIQQQQVQRYDEQQQQQHQHLDPDQDQQQQHQDRRRRTLQQQILTVSQGSDLGRTAQLLIQQLDSFGSAEMWCTGVTNQVYGIGVLVTAQEMLASRGSGLAATFQLAPPDGEPDHEKRSIKKLIVGAVPAPPPDPSQWAGPGLRTSTARVRGVAELAASLKEGVTGDAGGHALEGRGEQGINRALRAVLALQAEMGEPLAVWPWYGPVEDVGAGASREDERVVPGTVLLVRRCQE